MHLFIYRLFGGQPAPATSVVPPKPKKPLTPYFRFLGQVREDVKKDNPNLKPTGNFEEINMIFVKLPMLLVQHIFS